MKPIEILNTTLDKGFFKSFIPLSEANGKIQIFEKEIGGVKKKYLRGVATNTLVDKEDEKLSKNFINKIKSSILGLNVFSEHEHSIDKTLGYIDEVSGDENNVIVDVALEDENENIIVKSILSKIQHGTKIGYSIGGKILKATKEFDETLNKWVKELEDGEIYEVSLTAMPAGEGTWVAPIQKSMKEFLTEINKTTTVTTDEIKKHISKTLDEIMQENQIQEDLWEIFYSFRSALYSIMESKTSTPEQKRTIINDLSAEFGQKVEEFSIQLAELSLVIEEQLGITQ